MREPHPAITAANKGKVPKQFYTYYGAFDALRIVDQYFIFSFADSSTLNIIGIPALKKKLQSLHFTGDTTFLTIDQYGAKL